LRHGFVEKLARIPDTRCALLLPTPQNASGAGDSIYEGHALMTKPPRLLVIAGSDSSGGAGIQADIKTATAFGVYAMTAITAVTVQDTTTVHAIHPIPAVIVRDQIACCLSDIGADAIKIGMLGSSDVAAAVAETLERHARGIPIVLDPVMAATSGTVFLDEDSLEIVKSRLLPLAALLTPNIPEAQILSGASEGRDCPGRIETMARSLIAQGTEAVLVKGGHGTRPIVEDTLVWNGGIETYSFARIKTKHTHGTGCTLSTAIACGLARGLSLPLAVGRAREYLQHAIETSPGLGAGNGPLNHMHQR
jgi:hydroxymethylpyrimidine/phosphomethylpyrimidine kinase